MAVSTYSHEQHRTGTWWLFLLEGIAAILFGLLLLTAPGSTLLALAVVLGFYWLAMGVLELVRVFVDRSVPWIWSLLIGVVGIIAGILVLNHPLFAALALPATLVVYLGVLGLVAGVFGIIGGFTGGGIGSFIFGVINLLIGMLLLSSPIAAAIAVPFVFGVLLLIEGVGLIIWSFKVRSVEETEM
jgi:uncharacterized membrane protein HdeD (DUF308 family)